MRPRNKPRLYLTLYARVKYPNTYHYALQVSPKNDQGEALAENAPAGRVAVKYHCTNILRRSETGLSAPWTFEQAPISPLEDDRLLVRILLGKLQGPLSRFDDIMRRVPVRQSNEDPGYNCIEWIRLAIESLKTESGDMVKMTGSGKEWESIHEVAIKFVEEAKKSGRFEVGWTGQDRVATLETW